MSDHSLKTSRQSSYYLVNHINRLLKITLQGKSNRYSKPHCRRYWETPILGALIVLL